MAYQNRGGRRPAGRRAVATEANDRPTAFRHLKRHVTLWADYKTGQGMLGNGQRIPPRIGGRRKNPNLVDMLETAADAGAERIMFTGRVPTVDRGQRHWLLVQTPGWRQYTDKNGRGHWLENHPTGRFERIATGQRVEVRTAREWFGDTPLTPEQARTSWGALEAVVARFFPDGKLSNSPAATGANLWAISLPKNVDPVRVTEDIAEELHRTTGQHHIEHLVAGDSLGRHADCLPMIDPAERPKIENFAYVDGRFMYAALCRELGIGPAIRLNRSQAYDLLEQDPYARARVYVKFKVPQGWNHLGIFGVQHESVADGWYYPNRPGAVGETWADTAEIQVAKAYGWQIDPQEAIVFNTKVPSLQKKGSMVNSRPLDTWANRLIKAREAVAGDPEMPEEVQTAVAGALRSMLIQTIGNFASWGKKETRIAYDPRDVDPAAQDVRRKGKAFIWTVMPERNRNLNQYYRPELAVQVWARGRARLLSGPMANGVRGGALHVPGHTLIGVRGDAIYTTELPTWSLPVEHGGADDGAIGRMRLQGFLEGPMKTPAGEAERNTLRAKAAKQGVEVAFDSVEFNQADDSGDPSEFLPADEDGE